MNLTGGDTPNWENPLENMGVLGTNYLQLLLSGFNAQVFPSPTSEIPSISLPRVWKSSDNTQEGSESGLGLTHCH